MPKDTKTLGNSKARACESLGFVHKKGCARVLTQPLYLIFIYLFLTTFTLPDLQSLSLSSDRFLQLLPL